MPIPPHIAELRSLIGHRLLIVPTARAVVIDDDRQVVLGRDRDCDYPRWMFPGGVIDPAEHPADAAVRECFEETGIVAIPEALTSVTASPVITHKTGDLTQHIDITFRCRAVGGDARPYDGEFAEVRWYPFDDLPHMDPYDMSILRLAIERRDSAAFTFSGLTDVLGLRDDDSHRAGTY